MFRAAEDNDPPQHQKMPDNFLVLFADGECDSTVRKVCFNLLDQRDDFLICKPAIFSALKDKGAKASSYPVRQQFWISVSLSR